jgi:hypothetical protein
VRTLDRDRLDLVEVRDHPAAMLVIPRVKDSPVAGRIRR